jgi:predicted hydrolase (HD superfamily)
MMSPKEARTLMMEWVESDALRTHMECVAACMESYCSGDEEDRSRWIVTGLLHDFDYERHPTKEEHPFVGVDYLRNNTDVGEEVIDAILGHATYSGVPRTTDMAKTLFAVDELSGFIVACALVRPTGLEGMRAKSVRKKLKNKKFAAAVSREDITTGIDELGVELSEHIDRCIDAISAAGINIHTQESC